MLIRRSETASAPQVPDAERSLEDHVAALASTEAALRLEATRHVAEAGDGQAVAALCTALAAERESVVRDAMAVALARRGGADVVEGLLPLLRSDEAAVRNIAIDILKELPLDVAPRMEALLDDEDPDVRIFVVNVLEALRHPRVEDWLIAVITMDQNANVVITALDLLNEVGTPAALPALENVVRRFPDEPFVAFSADIARKRIGSGR
ncbi:hypothetical protein BJF93_19110 [Xaviernesmea oryzae]|uniref:HEAT repeat domain-containing protein n=1 Tax=Xaviernesmea oryzae TaxID=464029 RepID=A0A1Q9B1B2_9HYPH|nr:HEAT repeat domain-containing protein [Xaviernesmea oryzae]OLP61805.1 hypothetical protein BJF93_19110 [Xaviernesmea oryzae]SEL76812.1 HEAT repeat-containing protein [Xaviernesmea oryzae]